MAVRFIDSFDHYPTADNVNKYDYVSDTIRATIAANGRFGNGMSFNEGAVGVKLDSQTTWYVGFAWKASLFGYHMLYFKDGTNFQVGLKASNTNPVYFWFTRNGTKIGSDSQTLTTGQWYHIEVMVVIGDGTNGTASLRINGIPDLTQTGLDTYNAGNVSANWIYLGTDAFGSHGPIDDLVIADGTGGQTWMGDCRVESIVPTGAGTYSQWTPSAGSNWENVDETVALADTTYNSTLTALQKDTFTYGNLSTTAGTVYGVQTNIGARKDDAGSRAIAQMVRQNNTDYVSSTTHSLNTTYRYCRECQATNPATGVAWTIDDINTNAEFGYRLES